MYRNQLNLLLINTFCGNRCLCLPFWSEQCYGVKSTCSCHLHVNVCGFQIYLTRRVMFSWCKQFKPVILTLSATSVIVWARLYNVCWLFLNIICSSCESAFSICFHLGEEKISCVSPQRRWRIQKFLLQQLTCHLVFWIHIASLHYMDCNCLYHWICSLLWRLVDM